MTLKDYMWTENELEKLALCTILYEENNLNEGLGDLIQKVKKYINDEGKDSLVHNTTRKVKAAKELTILLKKMAKAKKNNDETTVEDIKKSIKDLKNKHKFNKWDIIATLMQLDATTIHLLTTVEVTLKSLFGIDLHHIVSHKSEAHKRDQTKKTTISTIYSELKSLKEKVLRLANREVIEVALKAIEKFADVLPEPTPSVLRV